MSAAADMAVFRLRRNMTQTTDRNPREKLYKILLQERAAGFRNTVVIGGLDGFLQRYLGELRSLLEGLSSYAALAPEERARWAEGVVKGLRSSVASTRASRASGPASASPVFMTSI